MKISADSITGTLMDTSDALWACSASEIGFTSFQSGYLNSRGTTYPIFTDSNSRKRYSLDGLINDWWTRTVTSSNDQAYYAPGGSKGNQNTYHGVLPGFCIGANGGVSDE